MVGAVALAAFTLTSPAFHAGATIPRTYTCDGRNVSPPLRWTAPPRGTKSFAIVVDDPDAPGGTFRHWIGWRIPATARALRAGQHAPAEGRNDAGGTGYTGPCPPPGKPHRYVFRLLALDTRAGPPFAGHVLGAARLVGRFGR